MKERVVKTARGAVSRIMIGQGLKVRELLPRATKTVLVVEEGLQPLYKDFLADFETIAVPSGEALKTLEKVELLYAEFLARGLDRGALIVAFGGGALCDAVGFAASTYLRGLHVVYVPTTLLAQVDASIGGKTGLNFRGVKNLIGTFRQPDLCLVDVEYLKTLPRRDFIAGFAEIIKHGAILDCSLLEYLETHREALCAGDLELLAQVVGRSIEIKANIVEADEREDGERRLLNFGHTIGHALEILLGCVHGEAVALGMCLAARVSVVKGLLSEGKRARLEQVIAGFGLPCRAAFESAAALDLVLKDKKRYGDTIKMVLLKDLGEAVVEDISTTEVKRLLDDLCSAR